MFGKSIAMLYFFVNLTSAFIFRNSQKITGRSGFGSLLPPAAHRESLLSPASPCLLTLKTLTFSPVAILQLFYFLLCVLRKRSGRCVVTRSQIRARRNKFLLWFRGDVSSVAALGESLRPCLHYILFPVGIFLPITVTESPVIWFTDLSG